MLPSLSSPTTRLEAGTPRGTRQAAVLVDRYPAVAWARATVRDKERQRAWEAEERKRVTT